MPPTPRPYKTPDVTPVQLVAIVGAIVGLAIAVGVPLSDGKQHAITLLVTVLASVLVVADAAIRFGRARGIHPAVSLLQTLPPAVVSPLSSPASDGPQPAPASAPDARPEPLPPEL